MKIDNETINDIIDYFPYLTNNGIIIYTLILFINNDLITYN